MMEMEIAAISRDRRRRRFRHLSHRPRRWGRFLYRCPLRSRFGEVKVDEVMVYGLRPARDDNLVRMFILEGKKLNEPKEETPQAMSFFAAELPSGSILELVTADLC